MRRRRMDGRHDMTCGVGGYEKGEDRKFYQERLLNNDAGDLRHPLCDDVIPQSLSSLLGRRAATACCAPCFL